MSSDIYQHYLSKFQLIFIKIFSSSGNVMPQIDAVWFPTKSRQILDKVKL